jgi:hypothetical protein
MITYSYTKAVLNCPPGTPWEEATVDMEEQNFADDERR